MMENSFSIRKIYIDNYNLDTGYEKWYSYMFA